MPWPWIVLGARSAKALNAAQFRQLTLLALYLAPDQPSYADLGADFNISGNRARQLVHTAAKRVFGKDITPNSTVLRALYEQFQRGNLNVRL